MLLILLTLSLASALLWLYVRWTKVKNYWKERGIPHEPPHPILGSLTFLQKQNANMWMIDMAKKFPTEPYVGIWLFWRPALIVNDPDIARRVLVKDADNFRDRLLSSGKSDPIGSLNIFTVNDPLWSSIRRRLTVVFTASRLRSLQPLFATKTAELVQRIKADVASKKFIELRSTFTDFTTDIIGTSAFGVNCNATLTGVDAIREVTKDFSEYSIFRGLSWSSIFFFPELVDIFGFKLFPKKSTDFFRRIFKGAVQQRGGYDRPVPEKRDLLDALMNIKREAASEGEEITEDILLAQAVVFIQGGFDTSSSSLTYVVYELAHHPEIQEKVYQELVVYKNKLDGADFDSTILSEMPYLNAVIKESLRKYHIMGWMDRIAAAKYKIDEKLTIPLGTPVYVNSIGMHYNPDYFPAPEKFDPDRFLPENQGNILPFTYAPFGEGPRSCIGKRFGLQTVRFGLSTIIMNFKVRPFPNAKKPSEIEFEKRGMFLIPADALTVEFIERN